MVGNDIYRKRQAIQVVLPNSESLEDSEELFVVDIVIKLGGIKGVGVKADGMNFAVFKFYRENSR